MRWLILASAAGLVSACGLSLPFTGARDAGSAPVSAAALSPDAETPRPTARPGDDVTAASATNAVDGRALGTTLATLGDAGVPGLWLQTPLVSVEAPGRVTAEDGSSAAVTLIPSGGADGSGSRISLAAMQALGLPLTAVAELSVEAL
ncbi:MAG: hypothetical protein AAF914_14175 [Pseudomonadota bacterium]